MIPSTRLTFRLALLLHSIIIEAATESFRKENGNRKFLEVAASDAAAECSNVRRCDEPPLRKKRSLIFPTGSIIQLSLGIGINPNVQDISMNINFGFQQNVPLPTNLTQLRSPPGGRRGKAMSSSELFSSLEQTLERHGLNGNQCVRKSICEMAATSFNANEIIEEIITHIFTPSAHDKSFKASTSNFTQLETYIESEKLGQNGENCENAFPLCPKSLLSLISPAFN